MWYIPAITLDLMLNYSLTLSLFSTLCIPNLKFFDEMDEDGSEYNNLVTTLFSMLVQYDN